MTDLDPIATAPEAEPFDAQEWAHHYENAPTLDAQVRHLGHASSFLAGLMGHGHQAAQNIMREAEIYAALQLIALAVIPNLFPDDQQIQTTQLRDQVDTLKREVDDLRDRLQAEIDRRRHDQANDLGR